MDGPAAAGRVLALGYEGPLTSGAVIGAALLVVATMLLTALVGRWLVARTGDDDHPRSPRRR